MKNDFASINRIPPEVLSLIPKYWNKEDMDKNLITLTHVCRGWRELFIAYSSLWAHLDCTNTDKTRVYLKRSKPFPLEVSLHGSDDSLHMCDGPTYLEDAFLLVIPHIGRLKSLSIVGAVNLRNLTQHISRPAPLEELTIDLICDPTPTLDDALFGGNLSLLRTLHLDGVITRLPWKNLSKLTVFKLGYTPKDEISVTRLLDFFENAPHLREITLNNSIPTSSNASPGRVVPLPHLKTLAIDADLAHSILLNHLSIPARASLALRFRFNGDKSPLPNFLPKTARNLKNITSINLSFCKMEKFVRLEGPSGELYMFGFHKDWDQAASLVVDRRILRSMDYFVLSRTQSLAVTKYEPPTFSEIDKSPPYHILCRMANLTTLTLTQCNNLPFLLALNPCKNPSKLVLCPKLTDLSLYVETRNAFNIPELMSMAKERASRGAKLGWITIIGLGELVPGKEVFKLREHVSFVDYLVEEEPPEWDFIPGNGAN